MKSISRSMIALAMLGATTVAGAADRVVTQATMDQWKKSQSNWGRWGAEDQKGTLNLITPAVRKRAAAQVKQGIVVSLEREIVPVLLPPEGEAPLTRAPVQQRMLSGPPKRPSGSTDQLNIAAHGYTLTHFDALGHHLFDGKMYNGFAANEHLLMDKGLSRGSIAAFGDGVFTRGVLVDMPVLKGVPYLEPGTPIFAEDLEAWEKFSGVRIGPGDAVFIRTGRWERESETGTWDIAKSAAAWTHRSFPGSGSETSQFWAANPRLASCHSQRRRKSTIPTIICRCIILHWWRWACR